MNLAPIRTFGQLTAGEHLYAKKIALLRLIVVSQYILHFISSDTSFRVRNHDVENRISIRHVVHLLEATRRHYTKRDSSILPSTLISIERNSSVGKGVSYRMDSVFETALGVRFLHGSGAEKGFRRELRKDFAVISWMEF